jgi:hypothetical protein
MITQKIRTTLECVTAEFSNGDIAVGVDSLLENGKWATIILENMNNAQEIGSAVSRSKCTSLPIMLKIDNVKSATVLKDAIEKVIKILENEEREKFRFTVPCKNIIIPGCFRASNPAAEKIMTCAKVYEETGNIDRDIVVDENLKLKDGYVGYLVARFNKMEKLKVYAPDGIKIMVGGKLITFKSNKIHLFYDGNNLIITNGEEKYEVHAYNYENVFDILEQINKVFDAEYTICCNSIANDTLAGMMKSSEMKVNVLSK